MGTVTQKKKIVDSQYEARWQFWRQQEM